jgi:Na+/H+-dicarboxylate symporter
MPMLLKQVLYSASLTIKDIIVMLLPVVVFCLLFKAAVMLSTKATKVIGLILALVCVSNFVSTFLSHFVGEWVYGFDLSLVTPSSNSVSLDTLWQLKLPKLIANDKAMFAGIVLGIIACKALPRRATDLAHKFEKGTTHLLQAIVYLIPVFVAGFIVKLQYDGVMASIIKDYSTIFVCVAVAQFGYIALVYFLLSGCKLQPALQSIRNMLPAAISGFSTMSSAASMPLTLVGVERNCKNKDIARCSVPATVNIHLVGDCFAIPIFAYAVLKGFGVAEPSLLSYMTFACYFVLAKFSVAAIPGGGIIVMLPILEAHLGFNSGMMSLITALYILFDPVITCANVLGNGAFAKAIDTIVHRFKAKN